MLLYTEEQLEQAYKIYRLHQVKVDLGFMTLENFRNLFEQLAEEVIGCFIPSAVPYIKEGFAVLETMPQWYQITVSVIVAASFGVRSVIGFMNRKKK
jgi:hypothetical protein